MSEIDESYNGSQVLEKLVDQIEAMEADLIEIKYNIAIRERESREVDPLEKEAKMLDAETNMYKTNLPDLQSNDKGVSYFLAVGALEKDISELKDYNNLMDKRITGNEAIIKELEKNLAETKQVVERFEKLAAEKNAEMDTSEKEKYVNESRLKMENDIRLTKEITTEFKKFLKDYINKLGTQEEGIEEDRVPIGSLLQELWKEFNTNDKDGWINIEDLEFDVREEDVRKLLACEIIRQRKDKAIQLVDYTMRF